MAHKSLPLRPMRKQFMCFVVLTFNGARLGGRELLEVLVERILLDARILVLILVPQDGLPVVMEP